MACANVHVHRGPEPMGALGKIKNNSILIFLYNIRLYHIRSFSKSNVMIGYNLLSVMFVLNPLSSSSLFQPFHIGLQ